MSNELNAKNGLIINNTQPVSGITNGPILDDENSLATSSAIYRALTGNTAIILNPSDIIATVTPSGSGISAGDTVLEGITPWDFVRQLIAPYVKPAFSAFVMNFDLSGTLEIGRTATISTATYSATNDSEGTQPTNIYIIGTGWNSGIYLSGSPAIPNSTPIAIQKLTASSESWTIYGSGKYGTTLSRSTSKSWQYMHRFGSSSTVITDSVTAQSVIDELTINALSSGKARTVTCNSSNADVANYTYIAYDSSFGNISNIIQNGALPVFTAFTLVGDYSYINAYGATRTMRIYKSNSTGAFASGTTLALS